LLWRQFVTQLLGTGTPKIAHGCFGVPVVLVFMRLPGYPLGKGIPGFNPCLIPGPCWSPGKRKIGLFTFLRPAAVGANQQDQ
jgi:hypothetical protein